jgi:hypothetical protein
MKYEDLPGKLPFPLCGRPFPKAEPAVIPEFNIAENEAHKPL